MFENGKMASVPDHAGKEPRSSFLSDWSRFIILIQRVITLPRATFYTKLKSPYKMLSSVALF